MALVHRIYERLNLRSGVIGRFYNDGDYYMATEEEPSMVIRYSLSSGVLFRLDSRLLGVEEFEYRSHLRTGYSQGSRDKIWAMINLEKGWYECWYLDGEKMTRVGKGRGRVNAYTSPTALDMTCTFSRTGIRFYLRSRCVYRETGFRGATSVCLINQKYCLVYLYPDSPMKNCLVNIKTKARVAVPLQEVYEVMPASKNSETKFMWFTKNCVYVIDAEEIFNSVRPGPESVLTLENVNEIRDASFLKYDEISGNTIFLVNRRKFFIFDGTNAIPLIDNSGRNYYVKFPYLHTRGENYSRLFSYTVNNKNEIETKLVAESLLE